MSLENRRTVAIINRYNLLPFYYLLCFRYLILNTTINRYNIKNRTKIPLAYVKKGRGTSVKGIICKTDAIFIIKYERI